MTEFISLTTSALYVSQSAYANLSSADICAKDILRDAEIRWTSVIVLHKANSERFQT